MPVGIGVVGDACRGKKDGVKVFMEVGELGATGASVRTDMTESRAEHLEAIEPARRQTRSRARQGR